MVQAKLVVIQKRHFSARSGTKMYATRHMERAALPLAHRADSDRQHAHQKSLDNTKPIRHRQHRCNTALMVGRHPRQDTRNYASCSTTTGSQEMSSKDVVLASLFQDPRILEHDVLTVQEPWRNPFNATS
jgi:hypothetical protein